MMKTMRWASQIGWMLMLLGLTSCAGITHKLQPLDVSLADLSLIDVGLVEQRFGVGLRIRNPNGFDIPIEGLTYVLEIDAQAFARGQASGPAHIPKYGDLVIRTEAVSNLSRVLQHLQHLQTLQQQGKLGYRLHGQADLGGLRGLQPFSMDGEIALPDLLR